MKRLYQIFIIILISSCSLDNKTGIWKDASNTPVDKEYLESISNSGSESRYEDLFIKTNIYNEEKESSDITNFKIDAPTKIISWPQQFATVTNNVSNFSYTGNKRLIDRSPKLYNHFSRNNNLKKNIIFYKNNLITHDDKGTIFIYSLNLKKKIYEYNFYKKKFKNVKKKIYFIVIKDTLYAADNLGYLYAINLDKKSIIWAKNYGIPFRSNLQTAGGQIYLANQDNVIYSINIKNGDKNWKYETNLTFLKSDFENNISLDIDNNSLFFLNTSGQLYSINYKTRNINWMLNFKNSALPGDTDLFLSLPIVIKKNYLIVATEKVLFSYNTKSSLKNWSFPAELALKPILTTNYTYIITKNNLLICLNNETGNVLWSTNIFRNLTKKKIIKKIGKLSDFKITNNEINLFTKYGYLLSFNYKNGNLNYSEKISKHGISNKIIFLKDSMFLINNRNRLLQYN